MVEYQNTKWLDYHFIKRHCRVIKTETRSLRNGHFIIFSSGGWGASFQDWVYWAWEFQIWSLLILYIKKDSRGWWLYALKHEEIAISAMYKMIRLLLLCQIFQLLYIHVLFNTGDILFCFLMKGHLICNMLLSTTTSNQATLFLCSYSQILTHFWSHSVLCRVI